MERPSHYVRKTKPAFTNALIPGWVLLLAGMVVLTKFLLAGLLLMLLAIFALTLTEGLEIDFTGQRIRIFFGVFGLRFGRWESMPPIERITLVPVQVKYTMTGRTNITTEVMATYAQVRLYPQGAADYYIASMGKRSQCESDAGLLASRFGLECEKYTIETT
jgi:hypothetical protein